MDVENGSELTDAEASLVRQAILREVSFRPPTIGIVGVSGSGKSSTLNALFRTDLPIAPVAAATKEFVETDLVLKSPANRKTEAGPVLRIIDAPGLGEDLERDPHYLEMYRRSLPTCDAILWVMSARSRATALDQMYLNQLGDFRDRIVFGINQVDLIDPMNWTRINLPSREQAANIELVVADRKSHLEAVTGQPARIVAYSALKRYRLQELFTSLVTAANERAWMFAALKDFQPDDFIPDAIRARVETFSKKSVAAFNDEGSAT